MLETMSVKGMEFKRISTKEMDERLGLHSLYLTSKGEEGKCLVLENFALHKIDLTYRNLSRAKFMNCYMSHADFEYTELYRTNFHGSWLENANFYNANIDNADFSNANLNNAYLVGTHYWNADIDCEELLKAYLI